MSAHVQSALQLAQEYLAQAKKPLIVVLGPTASGKTSFSIRLAKQLIEQGRHIAIINSDSRQLYRYLDIGTAKITHDEMQGVPHHLFSVIDPKEKTTIAWYKDRVTNLIDALHAQKIIPMLVGGSMLYISAIIDDLEPAPIADPGIRQKLEEEYEKDGGEALRSRLREIDPESAASFPLENKRYLLRALEIYEQTGQTKSAQIDQGNSDYDLLIFGMDVPRELLHANIAQRTEEMFEKGWINEVQQLLEKGYSENDPGMESHGYRDVIAYRRGEKSFDETKQRIIEQTRQYVKRQTTWWRRDERIRWISP